MNRFSVGDVLGRSFGIWLKNLIPFTIVQLIVYSPILIYSYMVMSGDNMSMDDITTWGVVSICGGIMAFFVASGAMTYGVFQQLRGRQAGLGPCIVVGLKRMFPILGVFILIVLCFLGIVIIGAIVGRIAGPLALLMFIPMLMLWCALWSAVPIAVVERPGVFASLSRSAELTKGSRWSIFAIVFILWVLEWVVSTIIEKSLIDGASAMSDMKTYMLISMGFTLIYGSLKAVAAAVGYHDLRASKEGVGIEELAKVFD